MSELDTLLDSLARGATEPGALRAAIEYTLTVSPERSVEIRDRLQDARRKGFLSEQSLAPLLATISRIAGAEEASGINPPSGAEDATGINPLSGAEDATGINPPSGDEDAAEMNPPPAGEDATEINPPPGIEAETVMNHAAPEDGTEIDFIVEAGDVTELNPSDDATLVNQGAVGEDDRTLVTGTGDTDRTVVTDSAGSDQTVVTGDGGGFDILSDDSLAAAEGVQTGTQREFIPGDVLKDRFELVSKLGEGGMGAVWKAKDRLKEEARDRNPFVAVKLLQGDFKDHPEAFIALQREASKQQRLAHPNIATVYDFDRDGETVYMTMEAMDGEPMDSFIRKLPAEGLPEEEAMILIRDLCEGLAYAHQAGLVHSDLKPGNVFLVKDPERELGRIKLLDFGIARASSTKTDAEGEKTLFDPGQLGALTPTYATIEMFDGQDPDPRDDIYALAIIAYQLFTGKHPYAKKSAPKAKELGLEPALIEKLDKRQNRGFTQGLAFLRDARTPSVEEFLDGITRRKSRALLYATAAVLVLLVAGVLAWGPVKEEIQRRAREQQVVLIVSGDVAAMRAGLSAVLTIDDDEQRARILADNRVKERVIRLISQGDEASLREGLELIREPGLGTLKESVKDDVRTEELIGAFIIRGDEQSIRSGLKLIEPFDPIWQRKVKDQQPVKDAIIGFYTDWMYEKIDPANGKYDYALAETRLAELEKIYPDSADVFQVRSELDGNRNSELARLNDRYNKLLEAGQVIPDPEADDIGDVLAIVAGIDSTHPMLSDARIPLRFADLATAAMQAKDFEKAREFLLASTEYAADDPTLRRLRDEVAAELKRQADEQLAMEITRQLSGKWPAFDTLADFEAVRDDLLKLADLNPQSKLLADIARSLQQVLDSELARLRTAQDWQQSEIQLLAFAEFLDVPFLSSTRAQLSEDERTTGYERGMTPERQIAIEARNKEFDALLADPKLTPRWELEIRAPLNALIALLPVNAVELVARRDRLARLYLSRAREAREQQRFDLARNLVDRGKVIYPQLTGLDAERVAIAGDEEALRVKRDEERRLARIAGLKTSLLAKASADQPQEAREVLIQLGKELPADDEFRKTAGPQAIGEAYLRLARSMADRSDFDAAVSLAATGLIVAPFLEPLKSAHQEYRGRQLELAGAAQLDRGTPAARSGPARTDEIGRTPVPADSSGARRGAAARYTAPPALSIAVLVAPVEAFRPRVMPRYPALSDQFAETSAQNILSLAQSATLDLAALDQPLAGFSVLYPQRAPALTDEVVARVEERVRELLQRTPLDVSGLRVPLEGYGRLFPDRQAAFRQGIVAGVERRIMALSDARPLNVGALVKPLAEFAIVFPDRSDQLKGAVAVRLEGVITALAEASATDLTRLEAPMRAYRTLYPQRYADLAVKVGRTVGKRLSTLKVDTAASLVALGDPLTRFKALFPDNYPGVSKALSERAAKAIRGLAPQDIYAADKLRRAALKSLPGSAAIAAIRIELPLQEIIDGKKLLPTGKLNAARKKLAEAIAVDARHSDIPPFKKSLEAQTKRAQTNYDLYVRYTGERKDRAQRKKLFNSAKRAWSDNPKFILVKEPRAGSCMAILAGRGRVKRSTCYDYVSKRFKGPILVVVPAGGEFKKPYAIGKYEVKADHFNRFCKATRSCKPGASRLRKLPVTGVSLDQVTAYAKWLSAQASATQGSSVVYRLPTVAEWVYAAAADGKQPAKKSFNCRVTSGGSVIKGFALLNAGAGKENGWGLANHVGNAGELALSGAGTVILGGTFEDSLTRCGINMSQAHSGAPDPLIGFRLVREIPS